MRDPANVAEYSVYVCDFSKMDDGNRGVGKYSASGCTYMKDAKAFAVGIGVNYFIMQQQQR